MTKTTEPSFIKVFITLGSLALTCLFLIPLISHIFWRWSDIVDGWFR